MSKNGVTLYKKNNMGYFLMGYVSGVGSAIVAVVVVIVLARVYDRIKEKRNAVNNSTGR